MSKLSIEQEEMMLEARRDLGNHRLEALPLSGKTVPQWMLQSIKPVNLSSVKDEIAVWHTALVDEGKVAPVRQDGIGSGGLHRLGPNFRPHGGKYAGSRAANLRAMRERPGSLASRISKAPRPLHVRINGTMAERSRPSQPRSSNVSEPVSIETTMKERSWKAAYPDPHERRQAIETSLTGSQSIDIGVSKRSKAMEAIHNLHASMRTAEPKPEQGPRKTAKKMALTVQTPSVQVPPAKRSTSGITSQLRPPYDPGRLSDQPFWLQKPSKVGSESQATSKRSTGQPVAQTQPHLQPLKNRDVADPRNVNESNHSKAGVPRLSNNGFVQMVSGSIPSHYRQVVFPPREYKAASEKSERESDSCHYSDVYSDPNLSHRARRMPNEASGSAPVENPNSASSTDAELVHLIATLQKPGLLINEEATDPEASETGDQAACTSPTSRFSVETRLSLPLKNDGGEPGIFLFKLTHQHRSWDVYDYHEPSVIASQVFLEFGIEDKQSRDSIREQIVGRFDRNLAKMRRKLRKTT